MNDFNFNDNDSDNDGSDLAAMTMIVTMTMLLILMLMNKRTLQHRDGDYEGDHEWDDNNKYSGKEISRGRQCERQQCCQE